MSRHPGQTKASSAAVQREWNSSSPTDTTASPQDSKESRAQSQAPRALRAKNGPLCAGEYHAERRDRKIAALHMNKALYHTPLVDKVIYGAAGHSTEAVHLLSHMHAI